MITLLLTALFTFSPGLRNRYHTELNAYIDGYLHPVRRTAAYERRHREAVEMVPMILRHCETYNVDPLRVATLAELEGSWNQVATGKAGEVGPLQVMPKWFKRFGLQTLDSQIEAGVWWLSVGIEKCGDNARAWDWYRAAHCKRKPSSKALFRERRYQRAVKRYRGK